MSSTVTAATVSTLTNGMAVPELGRALGLAAAVLLLGLVFVQQLGLGVESRPWPAMAHWTGIAIVPVALTFALLLTLDVALPPDAAAALR